MGHAEIDSVLQCRDRALAVAAIAVPGALPDHGDGRTAFAERTKVHALPQSADVGDHHRAGRGFRDVDLLAVDSDISAGFARAGFYAGDPFAIGREYKDMAEPGVRDEQPPGAVHGDTVG